MAKIAIDAGHGLKTFGKRCKKSLDSKETREWVLNDRVADSLASYLKSAGHTIKRVDDTDGSADISLANRVTVANKWGADFYISIHHNAGINGGSGGGTLVYTCKNCSSKSSRAQEAIYRHAIARGDLKGNRADGKPSYDYYVVKKTQMPACLIECGFMDSSTDIEYILNPKWSKKIALGIAEGICEVFGGKVDTSADVGNIPSSAPFLVKVVTDSLNIRKGAGAGFELSGTIKDKGLYTIVETARANDGGTWGRLKSGKGWINISSKYVERIQ